VLVVFNSSDAGAALAERRFTACLSYAMRERCYMSVHMPAEVATEYVDNFSTLVEFMTIELADVTKRKIKRMRIRDCLVALRFQNTSLDILHD
jgi:hypothetical protein